MKKCLIIAMVLLSGLVTTAAQAAPLATYTGKLYRGTEHGAEQVYRLKIEKNGRDVTSSLPAGVAHAIDGIVSEFAVAGVAVPQNQHVMMAVSRHGQFELDVTFTHTTSHEKSYLSCFQSWYTQLLKISADKPNQAVLTGLLSSHDETARNELASEYAPLLQKHIWNHFDTCDREFDEFVLDDVTGFLSTGLTRWLSGRPHPEYAGFWRLLDESKQVFEVSRERQLVEVDAAQFIKAWLGGIRSKETPEIVFQRLPQVLDFQGKEETQALLGFQAMRYWVKPLDRNDYFSVGSISPSLDAALKAENSVLRACFGACVEGEKETFRCRPEDSPHLMKFTLSSGSVGDISFLRAAE